MLSRIFVNMIALVSGGVVSAGLFALLVKIGVYTRLVEITKTGKYIKLIESSIILGGIFGNIISIFFLGLPFGKIGLIILGLFSGMFVGSMYMALAEILSIIPIVFRRLKLKYGLGCVVLLMGLGKMAGSLLYFLKDWGI